MPSCFDRCLASCYCSRSSLWALTETSRRPRGSGEEREHWKHMLLREVERDRAHTLCSVFWWIKETFPLLFQSTCVCVCMFMVYGRSYFVWKEHTCCSPLCCRSLIWMWRNTAVICITQSSNRWTLSSRRAAVPYPWIPVKLSRRRLKELWTKSISTEVKKVGF